MKDKNVNKDTVKTVNSKTNRTSKAKKTNGKNRKEVSDGTIEKKNTAGYMGSRSAENTTMSAKGRDNNPNWYFLDQSVAEMAAGFSFDQFVGVTPKFRTQFMNTETATASEVRSSARIPGMLVLEVNPCPGDTKSITTGINMASLKTYTSLSSMNAKTTNYAPQDITTLVLAMGELVSLLEHIRRTFGVAFTYNQRNRDLPYKLIHGMGFDPDDFLNNIAQHRLQFNSWITAINKIPFLDNIAYMYKCADMYQKVYTDSTSNMAQIVFMKPWSTWKINEKYNDQGTGLTTTNLPGPFAASGNTWDVWANIVESMLDAFFTSTTYNYIYSDILNYSTKTGAKLMYMDYLTEAYAIFPEYNRNFMLQVHNATIVGAPSLGSVPSHTAYNDVAPNVDKNIVDYNPAFIPRGLGNALWLLDDLFVDFDVPAPTLEDRIEATRYQAILQFDSSSKPGAITASAIALPDHYVVRAAILSPSNSGDEEVNYLLTSVIGQAENDSTKVNDVPQYILSTQIDWAPLTFVAAYTSTGNSALVPFGDVNYFTTLDRDWYNRVNDLTFQALFALR